MENLIMNTPIVQDYTRQWKEENLLQLAKHFHRLNKSVEQFERITRYNTQIQHEAFQQTGTDGQAIDEFELYMGIKTYADAHMEGEGDPDKEHFTFAPILKVTPSSSANTLTGGSIFLAFEPEVRVMPPFQSGQVPHEYRNAVGKNWKEIDNNLIDDLFVARNAATGQLERVNYYWADKNGIRFINEVCDLTQPITLYMGVDMNKFHDKNMISFTPVFGFIRKQHIATDFSMMGVFSTNSEEVFLEYTSPCPTTCPPQPIEPQIK